MPEQNPTTRRALRGRSGPPAGTVRTVPDDVAASAADTTVAEAPPPASPLPVATAEPAHGSGAPSPAAPAPADTTPTDPAPAHPPAGNAAATGADPAAATVASHRGITALPWLDPDEAAAPRPAPALAVDGAPDRSADLLAGRRRRTLWRPGTVVPTGFLLLLLGVYAAITLLWPLHNVAPVARAVAVETVAAPEASPAWPAHGSAALAVQGIDGTPASSGEAVSIASITKVVTALLVLDRHPLAPGEQGKEYAFTSADSAAYWQYRSRGESALDVPVGETLTELQMLQGMLIGSANNYADRLASDIWPTDADFADAAQQYLTQHGILGITIADPTGIEPENRASPGALVPLAERALANPVIAEIVRTAEITLPGAGVVRNGNPLLADPGVVGVKTGTLDAWNLLSAKDIVVGGTTVRAVAAVLGQPGPDERNAASRALFDRLTDELQLRPSVTAGTVVGRVSTLWGDDVDVVSAADASVVLWNGASASATTSFDLGDRAEAGDTVGTMTVSGPLDTTSVEVRLTGDIEPPSVWWRLTHPLDLFGLNG